MRMELALPLGLAPSMPKAGRLPLSDRLMTGRAPLIADFEISSLALSAFANVRFRGQTGHARDMARSPLLTQAGIGQRLNEAD